MPTFKKCPSAAGVCAPSLQPASLPLWGKATRGRLSVAHRRGRAVLAGALRDGSLLPLSRQLRPEAPRPRAGERGRKPSPQAGVWAGTKRAATKTFFFFFALAARNFWPLLSTHPRSAFGSLGFVPAARAGPGLRGRERGAPGGHGAHPGSGGVGEGEGRRHRPRGGRRPASARKGKGRRRSPRSG